MVVVVVVMVCRLGTVMMRWAVKPNGSPSRGGGTSCNRGQGGTQVMQSVRGGRVVSSWSLGALPADCKGGKTSIWVCGMLALGRAS
jgi:hypothetical protein